MAPSANAADTNVPLASHADVESSTMKNTPSFKYLGIFAVETPATLKSCEMEQ